jgi:hypothetical protein
VSDKKYSTKNSLPMYSSPSFFLPSVILDKPSPSVFQLVRIRSISIPPQSAQAPSPLPVVVTVTFLCRVLADTRQSLYRVSDKKYSTKNSLPMYSSPSFFLPSVILDKPSPSVFQPLPSFKLSAKKLISVMHLHKASSS